MIYIIGLKNFLLKKVKNRYIIYCKGVPQSLPNTLLRLVYNMIKNSIEKALKHTLLIYGITLIIIFSMKIVGINYFGIDLNDKFLIRIDKFFVSNNITNIYYFASIFIYSFCFISIYSNKKEYKKAIILSFINAIIQILLNYYNLINLYAPISLILFIIFLIISNKKIKIGYILYLIIVNILFQFVSLYIRGENHLYESFIYDVILNVDYLLLCLIFYKINMMKGENKVCLQVVGLFLVQWTKLKVFLKKLPNLLANNKKKFKNYKKEDKVATIIFITLSLLYNIFTLVIIFLVAFINDTVIECILLLSSFMISKSVFGKTFHFKTASMCFIISNLTYYILNRIVLPIETSILIPLILGIALAFGSSLLVKNKENLLYRGMPIEVFNKYILKIADINSTDYNICKMFYVDGWSETKIAIKVNYSIPSIQIKKKNINKKLKELI